MPKKRSPGDGGLYENKARKLWRGVVDVGFWPDGRRRQKEVTSRTQAGARAKMLELRKEIAEHGEPLDRTTTVAAWSEHWLTTVCRPNMKPNGLAAYESVTRNWIVPTIGKKSVHALKPSDVRLVIKKITDAGRSSSTALKTYNVLSGMLESARLDGLAARNVAADVTTPTAAISNRGALAPAEALAVLATAAEDAEGTRWWVALLAGLRQSERLGARIDSLDLDNNMLTVEWALEEIPSEHGCGDRNNGTWPCGKTRGGSCTHRKLKVPDGFDYLHLYGRLCLIRPKSGKARQVPIVPALAEALRRYLLATAHRPNPYGLIWRHEDGTPFLPGQDEQMWRDILHRAGIITLEQTKAPKDRTPGTPDIPTTHWARHTTVTVLMELGVDAKIIGEIVGHVSESTTRGYQHVSTPAAREAMARIGAHFASVLER
jgi:integrase